MRVWERYPEEAYRAAVRGAQIVRPCPWCSRRLRPCNLSRHIAAQHFRQLTIDDALADVEAQR